MHLVKSTYRQLPELTARACSKLHVPNKLQLNSRIDEYTKAVSNVIGGATVTAGYNDSWGVCWRDCGVDHFIPFSVEQFNHEPAAFAQSVLMPAIQL